MMTTVIALRNSHGEFLLHIELRQPYINIARFPSSKIHNNEDLLEVVRRKLHEKFGENSAIAKAKLQSIGTLHLRMFDRDDLTIENYAFIFTGQFNGRPPKDALWWNFDHPASAPKLMPGVREVADYVSNDQHDIREYKIIKSSQPEI